MQFFYMNFRIILLIHLFISLFFFTEFSFAKSSINTCTDNTTFNVGAAMHDITGPVAEEGMMGYGMLQQRTAGLLQRLWARAFVIESPCNNKRIVFVNVDLGQAFQGIKQQVIKQLQKKYGDTYRDENVLITAIHTHSGPGGYSTYAFYNITTLGFSRENFNIIVDGIVDAISDATANMRATKIKMAEDELSGISFNRSPDSYLLNPSSERAQYRSDTDQEMSLLRFESEDGKPFAMINWFPLHGVSMNNKNDLINGDNKGYAEYLFEKDFSLGFVAAFAQSNSGDVSPNRYGHEGGEGLEGLSAVEKAGRPQYEKAKTLFNNANNFLKGGVDYKHTFVDMGQVSVDPIYTDGRLQKTCPAAIGVSMLAGTQDGEGIGWQGISCSNLSELSFLSLMCNVLTNSCQGAKPIAIPTGSMLPYPWTPNILPLQIFKIGNFVIVAAPFELTTMTGRRIKNTVAKEFTSDDRIVLSTLANAYAGYVATHEEYIAQRYEAASTHFGPWTEAALQQEFDKLARALVRDEDVPAGPTPPDLSQWQIEAPFGVIVDFVPFEKSFGDVEEDVAAKYKPGDTVKVIFWGGHPRNNPPSHDEQTNFLSVEKLENADKNSWQTIRTDNDWDTSFYWQRSSIAYSLITIEWRIPQNIQPGQYRIAHFGKRKSLDGNIYPYQGQSSVFTVDAGS